MSLELWNLFPGMISIWGNGHSQYTASEMCLLLGVRNYRGCFTVPSYLPAVPVPLLAPLHTSPGAPGSWNTAAPETNKHKTSIPHSRWAKAQTKHELCPYFCFGLNFLLFDHLLYHALSKRQEHGVGELLVLCRDGLEKHSRRSENCLCLMYLFTDEYQYFSSTHTCITKLMTDQK